MFLLIFLIFSSAPFTLGQIFDPIRYGAKGDGTADDTDAVRATLAAVALNNGGEVLFDAGYSFLTGCFNLTSNVILNVRGTILASQDSSNYVQIEPLPWYGGGQDAQMSGSLEWHPVIRSYHASNITITGGGTIDGQGAPWWTCLHRGNDTLHLVGAPCNGVSRPNLIMLVYTTDVAIHDITLKDSPSWTTHIAYCTNVHIYNVTVKAPWDSPNTDGFDIDCSVNVLLENSYYSGGDDAIAIQSGMNYFGRTFGRPSENILIRNMTIGRSHGLSIGSEMSAGVRNVTFENISVNGSDAGVKVKSERGRGAYVRDVTYSNIHLYNVKIAIYLTHNYHQNLPPRNETATPQFANFNINNIYSDGAQYGWFLDGQPESFIGNVSFTNITLERTATLIDHCRYIYGSCVNVKPSCPPCMQAI